MSQPTIEILPLKKGFLRAAADASHALVRIVAPEKPTDLHAIPRSPLDIALVIDRSGSMEGKPLETAKECAIRIVNGLRTEDRVSIVSFDNRVTVVQALTSAIDNQNIVKAIKEISSGGSTDLFAGWEEGAKQLAPFTKKDRIARVILLSDGQANHGLIDENEIFERVTKIAGAGITTSTIGLGHGFNESLLSGMAKCGEGVANFGQEADDLDEAFEQQFAILSNSFLRQVEIKVQGGSDVKARLVGEILEYGASRARKLGTLPWGASLVAVVEMQIGQNAKGEELLAVNFRAHNRDGEVVKYSPKILSLPEVDLATFASLATDNAVASAISEAVISEKLEHVEDLLRHRKHREAKELFAEIEGRSDLTSWAKQKIAYLKNLLDDDMIMAMKEMRYSRNDMVRSAKAREMAAFSEAISMDAMIQESPALRRKIAAGRSVKRQTPTPPPATPDPTNGQA